MRDLLLNQVLPKVLAGLLTAAIISVATRLVGMLERHRLIFLIASVPVVAAATAVVLWRALARSRQEHTRLRRLGLIGMCTVITLYTGWVGTQLGLPFARIDTGLPLDVGLVYTFEEGEGSDVDAWNLFASTQSRAQHTVSIAEKEDFARSGTRSVQLSVELQAAPDYVGIGTMRPEMSRLRAILAWVLVPSSEHTSTMNCTTVLAAHGRDRNGELIRFNGKELELEPGVWAPARVALPFTTVDEDGSTIWNGAITELYVWAWCNRQYSGSIYIDDITFYVDSKTKP